MIAAMTVLACILMIRRRIDLGRFYGVQ